MGEGLIDHGQCGWRSISLSLSLNESDAIDVSPPAFTHIDDIHFNVSTGATRCNKLVVIVCLQLSCHNVHLVHKVYSYKSATIVAWILSHPSFLPSVETSSSCSWRIRSLLRRSWRCGHLRCAGILESCRLLLGHELANLGQHLL